MALEEEIAAFYGKKHCMVFTTGYQANLGVISTLVGAEDFLLIDADSHASIYDACKQTQAEVVRFKHNDPASLDARLRRLGDKPGNRLVVLEGIYSMLGDSAPLKEFVEVCKKYGAYVLVDEAHSLGALGEQRPRPVRIGGRARRLPLHRRHLLQDAGRDRRLLRLQRSRFRHPARHRARLHVHRLAAALDRGVGAPGAEGRDGHVAPSCAQQLWDNVHTLYDGLVAQGFKLGPEHGPVVGVHLPDRMTAIGFWRAMLDAGIYVNVAVPPATPNGVSLLRCSLCAAHTKEQLEHMIEVMTGIGRQMGVIGRPAQASSGGNR